MEIEHPEVNRQSNGLVRRHSTRPTPWVWEGVIAHNAITLISAPEKTGKSTLLSLLLDRRREGGELLGKPVTAGTTIVCSEEEAFLWAARQPPLDFGDHLEFCSPHGGVATKRKWRAFIDDLLEREEGSFDLLVIDTVMTFMPAVHRNRRALNWALHELRYVTDEQVAVVLLHQSQTHSRPLAAFADILIDLRKPPGDRYTRRRIFEGVGRYPGTLARVTADLNEAGTDYVVCPPPLPSPLPGEGPPAFLPSPLAGEGPGVRGSSLQETLRHLLSESASPLTRDEILARWPTGVAIPSPETLWRVLNQGVAAGVFVRSGAGRRGEGFRYELVRGEDQRAAHEVSGDPPRQAPLTS